MLRGAVCATVTCVVLAAAPALAQDRQEPRRGFVWDDRPTIVFGDNVNVEIKGRALVEWRTFDPEIGEDTFHVRTARVGVQGQLTKHFDWEIEREITEIDEKIRFGEWKDVYGEWNTFDAVSVKGGRFKMPFGLEQNTGVSDLDFAYRALGSSAIAPGRDRGLMAFGELGPLVYEAGVFDDDGDNGESDEPQFAAAGEDLEDVGPSVAIRLSGELFDSLPVGRLRGANVGVAYTNSNIPEGLNSLRGESVWGVDFHERVYVKGRRQRLGLDFDWTPGPVGVRAEWMQSREQRLQQSNRNADLSDFIGTAWYVSGTWFVTGEDKDDNITPRRPFLRGGIGAIELAARIEQLRFESADQTGPAFTNPRSEHLLPNSDTVLTVGVNWTASKWTRVIVNAIRENFDDAGRTPAAGTTVFWSSLVRLNIVF